MKKSTSPIVFFKSENHPNLVRFWEKWGIWIAIAVGIISLFTFTDSGDFMRGVQDGYTDSDRKSSFSRAESIGALIALAFLVALLIGVLSGLSYVYYSFFHRPVFKQNKVAYTILYIVCLLLLWNFMSDGMTKVLVNYKGSGEVVKRIDYNETLASVLASLLLIYLVIYGFITDYRKSQQVQLALVRQRTQAELDALKAQVNPHFLFNSLNNIYGTAIVEDSPRTAESILQLSGIVRYVMEESRLQTTDIQRELRFLDDFVELQRIRLPNQDNIDIRTEIEWDEKPARIIPLLLNPLIENAFKYGISIRFPCFVHIRLRIHDGTLYLTTENSIFPRTELEKGTGLGLANVRQRLALAYPDRHTVLVEENENSFLVDLIIKL